MEVERKPRYMLIYRGPKESFDSKYGSTIFEMELGIRKYIELEKETIVIADYTGKDIGMLERKINENKFEDLIFERENQVYYR